MTEQATITQIVLTILAFISQKDRGFEYRSKNQDDKITFIYFAEKQEIELGRDYTVTGHYIKQGNSIDTFAAEYVETINNVSDLPAEQFNKQFEQENIIPASDVLDIDQNYIDKIRSVLNVKTEVDDNEIEAAIYKCNAIDADPIAGDVYLVPHWDKRQNRYVLTLMPSKDYYLRKASEFPNYNGFQAGVTVQLEDGSLENRHGSLILDTDRLVGGWALIRLSDREDFYHQVALSEYHSGQNQWSSRTATMIRKVAITQALREVYPHSFSQVYDEAEFERETENGELQEVRF